ncbi:hypothetical protein N7454_007201 [Penicillium verhagenii]|nr:hypothetical protein N7454_007201 [Penicillium verhagenii]
MFRTWKALDTGGFGRLKVEKLPSRKCLESLYYLIEISRLFVHPDYPQIPESSNANPETAINDP